MARLRLFVYFVVTAALALAAGAVIGAQGYTASPLSKPQVVAGPDLGLRIDGDQNGRPVGTLVIRVNGKWVEARLGTMTPHLLGPSGD
jgi:hypothetical protein